MKKKYCMIPLTALLIWFFLDMTGLYFGENCLVTTSYKDDGIFFIIYFVIFLIFIFKEKNWQMACCGLVVNMVLNTIFMSRMVYHIQQRNYGFIRGKNQVFFRNYEMA